MKGQRSETILAEVNCFGCLPADRVLLSTAYRPVLRERGPYMYVKYCLLFIYLFLGFLFLHSEKHCRKGVGACTAY